MMIEHDMGVVMDISHRVLVLDFGRKIAEGHPTAVLADPHVKRAYLGEEDDNTGIPIIPQNCSRSIIRSRSPCGLVL
jgi:energy-coupling factor transporter ATP-binding protein EcfA2